jgi:DNA mismatch endonuclease (patch repair protein)
VRTESWSPTGPRRIITDTKTSARLARVRQSSTAPELVMRRALAALGHRFRTRNRDLPGSPDIANRKRRWALFVHGCFWHRHPGCSRTTTPKRNRRFWLDKFQANRTRDGRAQRALAALGYRVVVVWECETERYPRRLEARLRRQLPARGGEQGAKARSRWKSP